MTRRGFSPANGFGADAAALLEAAGGVVSPPVYAGMVPSLLAAFSAPIGVSVVPSCLASSADTAASAGRRAERRDGQRHQ